VRARGGDSCRLSDLASRPSETRPSISLQAFTGVSLRTRAKRLAGILCAPKEFD
jgi:hypothetical protein